MSLKKDMWLYLTLIVLVIAGGAFLVKQWVSGPKGGSSAPQQTSGGKAEGSALDLALQERNKPEEPCPSELAYPEWRKAQKIDGVDIETDPSCQPDNPVDVAAVVKGTNNLDMMMLMDQTRLSHDAVIKGDDLDGDGDPDEIEIRLEVVELNGFDPDNPIPSLEYMTAPGITPGLWVFAPKTRGMPFTNFLSNKALPILRLPSPVIRVEQGDHVKITLENTHYFPHTIHLHGVDHPFLQPDGSGNDGVPMISEMPVMPGGSRTYEFIPRRTGTFFYHCHVQPHSHILMGLASMLVVEENRPNNWLQTLNIGAGRVRHRSVSSREAYDGEYDMVYQDMDKQLHRIIQQSNDVRRIAKAMNRKYKITERIPDYYLLNGHSFPLTMRDSMLIVKPNQKIKIRLLNAGSEPLYLHTHGHKPTITHRDGIPLPKPVMADTVHVGPAQRVDMVLNTINDGLHSYGPGAWLLHDHHEPGVTTEGIGPGGDIGLTVYESFLDENGLPKTAEDVSVLFNPAYWRGEVPVWGRLDARLYGGK